ncbi:glyoxalase superfamily protein [Granulosicoccus antarcticus]|uniref:Bleomycin resistance protein n=1 Tax=Granulosicoccus antarcticus IMCC3135 TaxID=1192854 RepID=A0A2Z2NX73_9GAMM|nr:glyoxalase superfamily protein [Granulosicoccus antarcticus]ASJ76042.1 Bleomycin resistance protein [Granulosicoccus antarcticus IMCC3135]
MNMQSPIPILRSFDEAKTKAFYLDFLGFDVSFEHRFDTESPLYFGAFKDNCVLHLSEHHGDACPGSTLRIDVDDVDAYCKELNAKGYQNARPGVQEQPWGYREMSIQDPSGNRLVFCTSVSN